MPAVVDDLRPSPASTEPLPAPRILPRSARRVCWGVFCLTLAVYVVTASGHYVGQDQEYTYRTARALVEQGTFAIQPLEQPNEAGRIGVDGRFYAHYAPGLSLAMAPLIPVGRGLEGLTEGVRARYTWGARDEADKAARILASYFNAPVTAATAALLALLVLRLGYPSAAAIFTALAYAFATFAWGQARVVFADPLQGLLLLLGVVLLLGASPSRAGLGGTALGLALLVKLTSVLALPLVLLLPDARGRALWRTPTTVALILGPALVALALHGLFNLGRYGDALNTGYLARSVDGQEVADAGAAGRVLRVGFANIPLVGFYGLLVSPARGVVWYALPIVAAAWAFLRFYRERRSAALAFGGMAALWLVVHGFWIGWHGGWGWGPRYLLPVLPLALVPLATCWLERRARFAAVGLVLVGVLIQLPGALVDFWTAGQRASDMFAANCVRCTDGRFSVYRSLVPEAADLKIHTELLRSGILDLGWVTFAGTWLAPVTLGVAALLAAAGLRLLWDRPMGTAPARRAPNRPGRRRPHVRGRPRAVHGA